jgi:hypothetical protein
MAKPIDLRITDANRKLQKLQKRLAKLDADAVVSLLGPELAAEWARLMVGNWATLPGVTCEGASECRAHVRQDRKTGKRSIVDGPHAEFRCFAASIAAQFKPTFDLWDHNTRALRQCKTPEQFADKIGRAIDATRYAVIRAGVSGDVESESHAAGLMMAVASRPNRVVYGYTKSPQFFEACRDLKTDNFRLTGSIGGRHDQILHDNNWRTVDVIGHERDATGPVDVDDLQALRPNFGSSPFGGENFHLIIHGTQQPGTIGAEQLKRLKAGERARKQLEVLS